MDDYISDEDIQELEHYQLKQYAEIGQTPVDYSDGSADGLISTLDPQSLMDWFDGRNIKPPPGSKYDHPGYRRMLARNCREFLEICPIARDNVAAPLIGLWPEKIPGGYYGQLSTGRPLIMFTEGAFLFFDKAFTAIAHSCYSLSETVHSEANETEEVLSYHVRDANQSTLIDKSYKFFRTAVLDLITKTSSINMRIDLGLPVNQPEIKAPRFDMGEISRDELKNGYISENLRSQCYKFLLGHEFTHILLDNEVIENLDQIPTLIQFSPGVREAYNTEINCDLIGAEYAIGIGQAGDIEPELNYAGVFLFFHVWHFVCRALWRLQFEELPSPMDPIYMTHPPTLIREHYTFDIMMQVLDEESSKKATNFRNNLYLLIESFWDRLNPELDFLQKQGFSEHIEPKFIKAMNPFFSHRYAKPT